MKVALRTDDTAYWGNLGRHVLLNSGGGPQGLLGALPESLRHNLTANEQFMQAEVGRLPPIVLGLLDDSCKHGRWYEEVRDLRALTGKVHRSRELFNDQTRGNGTYLYKPGADERG